ncbi:MAG TPA: PQQ-dependent sugar dehydrogenase [Propionibacteriaceae bacterium]|nr:PQQ-dependent sugar dehydrogenase [Propionibacteriaceae bacterium]
MSRRTVLAAAAASVAGACTGGSPVTPPVETKAGGGPGPGSIPANLTVVAAELDVPWDLAFLPDGAALATLRDTGQVVRIRPGADPVTVGTVPGVVPGGEGGLLGLALSPAFASDGGVYAYHTAASDNRIVRLTYSGDSLGGGDVIVGGIPKSAIHNGGRIRFGPDGMLYAGTGDGSARGSSQDLESLGGKILRVRPDGSVPSDNPYGSLVWTYGHRNVQGIGWDASGRMFASEFGQDSYDELNLVQKGGNYGWPVVEGPSTDRRFVPPLQTWRVADASPSGIAVTPDGVVYLAALRGQRLWRVAVRADGTVQSVTALYQETYGRLRHVAVGPDGHLWIVTSNRFRGRPGPTDDRVVILPDLA